MCPFGPVLPPKIPFPSNNKGMKDMCVHKASSQDHVLVGNDKGQIKKEFMICTDCGRKIYP
jgi:hypothetical protein